MSPDPNDRTLDPEMAALLEVINAAERTEPSLAQVAELRTVFATLTGLLSAGAPDIAVEESALDGPAGTLPVRLYRPSTTSAAPQAALMWFHGGGWVLGSLDTHDALCRDLAVRSGMTVIGVDYRLAPEHPWPAAHDDAEAAFAQLWARSADLGLDPSHLLVGGDSAGGSLALAVSRRRREAHQPLPAGQVLLYPVADLADPHRHRSYSSNGEGYLLDAATMAMFSEAYAPDPTDRSHPDLSPLRADLSRMPATLVIVAGFDPLRDEGIALAERLRSAGVDTEFDELHGALHMVAQMRGTALGDAAVGRIAAWLIDHAGTRRHAES